MYTLYTSFKKMDINYRAGAQRVIDRFIALNILTPKDQDKKYGQSYMYREYLDIFK